MKLHSVESFFCETKQAPHTSKFSNDEGQNRYSSSLLGYASAFNIIISIFSFFFRNKKKINK